MEDIPHLALPRAADRVWVGGQPEAARGARIFHQADRTMRLRRLSRVVAIPVPSMPHLFIR